MKVEIHTKASNNLIVYENALFAYQKLDMYCVGFMDNKIRKVHKYPLNDLFRSVEDYPIRSHGNEIYRDRDAHR